MAAKDKVLSEGLEKSDTGRLVVAFIFTSERKDLKVTIKQLGCF